MKGKRWILAKAFSGVPNEEHIKLEEFEIKDELEPEEVLFQAVYLSVDPYMRLFPNNVGNVMLGEQVSEVIKTRNGKYPLGTIVLSKAGWTSHYISKGDTYEIAPIRFDHGSLPLSYTLGTLGMPGATAFIGLNRCNPKPNETIVVTAAAGAVGSVVGQLAKLKGLRVIGIAGSDEKLNWCKNELGFDYVINYKKENFSEVLSKIAPDGIDIYYDNVGGEYYHTIINNHMKLFGRVLVVGSIQTYNDQEQRLFPATNRSILMKSVTVKGFMIYHYYQEWPEAFNQMKDLISDGKLKVKETLYTGIENMRDAFVGLFKGENTGKAVVKAINETTNYP